MNPGKSSTQKGTASGKTSKGFTAEERAAMKERARELKAEAQKANGESALWPTSFALKESSAAAAAKIAALVKKAVS